ncbi:MAG: hypothetical protein ACR2RE_17125 [Geminicoccaceae bacterium]
MPIAKPDHGRNQNLRQNRSMKQRPLLIGERIGDLFGALNSSLRRETLRQANRKLGTSWSHYTPWLCYAEKSTALDPYLLNFDPHSRGELINDPLYIQEAAKFLKNHGTEVSMGTGGDAENLLSVPEVPSLQFEAARDLLLSSGLAMSTLWHALIDLVIPMGGSTRRSYSPPLLRGAIVRALPPSLNPSDCALDLIQDLGHNAFAVWQSVDPIMVTPFFASALTKIRRVDRPTIQSFRTAVGLAFMLRLQQAYPTSNEMQKAARQLGKAYRGTLHISLEHALQTLREHCRFTEIGEHIMKEMEALLAEPDLSLRS